MAGQLWPEAWLGAHSVGLAVTMPTACSWYFCGIDRTQAQQLLLSPANAPGAFLIRPSESSLGDYSLSGTRAAPCGSVPWWVQLSPNQARPLGWVVGPTSPSPVPAGRLRPPPSFSSSSSLPPLNYGLLLQQGSIRHSLRPRAQPRLCPAAATPTPAHRAGHLRDPGMA